MNPLKIGIFDSGVGGLTILNALIRELPNESFHYIADQIHVPYGSRSLSEVQNFSIGITKYLISQGCPIIVVACNTASAAALYTLREMFPMTNFVGMEPAIKPAIENTKTGVIGVLATPATFQGQLYASLVERYGEGFQIYQDTCPGLVEQIESGQLNSSETRSILEAALIPMVQNNVDTIVLACTHYPFVIPMIKEISGNDVNIIDPAPAVARQTYRILSQITGIEKFDQEPRSKNQTIEYLTTGDPEKFKSLVDILLHVRSKTGKLYWKNEVSVLPAAEIY